jgi:hypothetical protein
VSGGISRAFSELHSRLLMLSAVHPICSLIHNFDNFDPFNVFNFDILDFL